MWLNRALTMSLALTSAACTDNATSAKVPVTASVEHRRQVNVVLHTKAASPLVEIDPVVVLKRAESSAAAGWYEQALDLLLWCFDHGLDSDRAFMGVWATAVPEDLGALASRYPPARAAAAVRLAQLRETILASAGPDFAPAVMFVGLASALGRLEETLSLFDALRARGPAGDDARYNVLRWAFDSFFEAGRYADISFYAERLLTHTHGTTNQWALRGAKVTYSLLRERQSQRAWAVADELTTRNPTATMYEILVDYARRAGGAEVATRLVAKGTVALPQEQRVLLRAVVH